MKLDQARALAIKAKEKLAPFCERIEIGGSIRREKAEPKDIELICIPKTYTTGLFGNSTLRHPDFIKAVQSWKRIKGDANGKYTQRQLEGINLDLFMCKEETWGMCFLIRTGPAEFVRDSILSKFKRWGYSCQDLIPTHGETNKSLYFKEEEEVFSFLDLPYYPPTKRNNEIVLSN